MNVLIIPSWYPSDSLDIKGVFFRDQAIALHNFGHNVAVLYPELKSIKKIKNRKNTFKTYFNDEGVHTYRIQCLAVLTRFARIKYLFWRKALLKLVDVYLSENAKPDLIHAHSILYGGIVATELGKKYNIPVVITEHSTGFSRNLYNRWQILMARKAARYAAARIAVSEPFSQLLNETLDSDWQYIPNIVSKRFYFSSDGKKNKPKNKFIILNLALMTEKKGQLELLKAFSELGDLQDSCELWFAGDGPLRDKLEEKAKELEVDQAVTFLGRIKPTDVPKLMSESDILVISSYYETFGVVAAEALMVGVPVVATKCGGPESIIGPDDGLLVEPASSSALAHGIKDLVEKYSNYDSKLISKRAKYRFGAEAVSSEISGVYQSVVKGQSSH